MTPREVKKLSPGDAVIWANLDKPVRLVVKTFAVDGENVTVTGRDGRGEVRTVTCPTTSLSPVQLGSLK